MLVEICKIEQAGIARTRAEAPQDVSSMSLRARMVDVDQENKERMSMTKNGEVLLRRSFVQNAKRSQRDKTCGVGNTDELTGASRDISPMYWVDTDENTHRTRTCKVEWSNDRPCRP